MTRIVISVQTELLKTLIQKNNVQIKKSEFILLQKNKKAMI